MTMIGPGRQTGGVLVVTGPSLALGARPLRPLMQAQLVLPPSEIDTMVKRFPGGPVRDSVLAAEFTAIHGAVLQSNCHIH